MAKKPAKKPKPKKAAAPGSVRGTLAALTARIETLEADLAAVRADLAALTPKMEAPLA